MVIKYHTTTVNLTLHEQLHSDTDYFQLYTNDNEYGSDVNYTTPYDSRKIPTIGNAASEIACSIALDEPEWWTIGTIAYDKLGNADAGTRPEVEIYPTPQPKNPGNIGPIITYNSTTDILHLTVTKA